MSKALQEEIDNEIISHIRGDYTWKKYIESIISAKAASGKFVAKYREMLRYSTNRIPSVITIDFRIRPGYYLKLKVYISQEEADNSIADEQFFVKVAIEQAIDEFCSKHNIGE